MGLVTTQTLGDKVEAVFHQSYPDARILLDIEDDSTRQIVHGFVISSAFQYEDSSTRHAKLTQVLKQHLTPDEQSNVHVVLLVTPEEYDFIREPQR